MRRKSRLHSSNLLFSFLVYSLIKASFIVEILNTMKNRNTISIPFNVPYISGEETQYIVDAIERKNLAGDGFYTKSCQDKLINITDAKHVLLTPSCTHALELSALLLDLKKGDEVIMPSFTFVSTANAFVLQGAVPVFVDIRPDTMNIDEKLIENAITSKTKAIVVMHYAGVACEMDTIMDIADQYSLFVIEDAAQCIGATYKGKHLGTIGHFGTFSFHSTKNIHCGEGGALLINQNQFIQRAEIIREKGTNRNQFLRGEVDKYSWIDIGSSILLGELSAAFLYAQLLDVVKVTKRRQVLWNTYYDLLSGKIDDDMLPTIPRECRSNAHIFYLKCKDIEERQALIKYLKRKNIATVFHYVPLHSAPAGLGFGRFYGKDEYTTVESEKLLRLPLYYDLENVEIIAKEVVNFLNNAN